MSLLKIKFNNKNKIPNTANSAEKKNGNRFRSPTKPFCVKAADIPDIIDAPATYNYYYIIIIVMVFSRLLQF